MTADRSGLLVTIVVSTPQEQVMPEPAARTEQRRAASSLTVFPFPDGPRTVVVVAGDADGAAADRLRDQLVGALSCRTRSLVVDLGDLSSCDPESAGALRTAVREAEARGVAVSLRGQSAQVAQLLRADAQRAG